VLRYLVVLAALTASPLFSGDDPIPLQLDAPFNDLFEHARNEAYAVTGELRFTSEGRLVTVRGVSVSLRGNTSKRQNECSFPKLKVEFPEEGRPAAPPFAGLTSIKIGTHCGESATGHLTQRFGRLANQRSPLREVFVYRLLAAMGVPTLQARPSRITYRYTDAREGQSPPQDQPIVRDAMLLEGAEAAVRRVGGRRDIGEKAFTNAQAQFTPSDTARLAFAEAMIGNFDWCVKMTPTDTYRCDARHPLWNVVAAELDAGKAVPLMQDFDVAGIVTGRHAWFPDVFSTAFRRASTEPEIEVIAQLQRTRTLFTRSVLDRTRAEFIGKKPNAYQVLGGPLLDPEGREIARRYLDSFYAHIESDAAFYGPIVVGGNARAYAAADGGPVCGTLAVVPAGTPVSDPVQTSGGRIQVMLLDALWHWAPPVKCAAVRNGPVWLDAGVVGRDFPRR